GPFADRSPACSPDGNWLVYDSLHSDKATLWKIAIDGGPAHQLTTDVSQDPEVSPDGKRIACTYRYERACIVDSETGEVQKRIGNVPLGVPLRWSEDSRELIYYRDSSGVSNLFAQPIDGGPERQLTHFDAERIFDFDWSRDHRRLALVRGVETR